MRQCVEFRGDSMVAQEDMTTMCVGGIPRGIAIDPPAGDKHVSDVQ